MDWLPTALASGYSGAFGIEHHKKVFEYEGTHAQLTAFVYALLKIQHGL